MYETFISTFNGIARHKHRYKVFEDFVKLSAISLHNGFRKSDVLEQEYFEIIADYKKDEVVTFAHLLGELVNIMDSKPFDAFGQLYMTLEISNKNTGQFFTPDSITQLMAKLVYGGNIELPECGFVTLSEPACGAGGMVLAYANEMINQKLNPAHCLWTQCIDIDRTVALMCYVQLTLWNIPGQIIIGNSLTLEYREQWFTPAHYLYNWGCKLKRVERIAPKPQKVEPSPNKIYMPSQQIVNVDDCVQLDLFG